MGQRQPSRRLVGPASRPVALLQRLTRGVPERPAPTAVPDAEHRRAGSAVTATTLIADRTAALAAALTAALAPVPELAFALQCASAAAAVGATVALRAKRSWGDVDTWRITTAWATLGLVIGLLVAGAGALAGAL